MLRNADSGEKTGNEVMQLKDKNNENVCAGRDWQRLKKLPDQALQASDDGPPLSEMR